MAYSCSCHVHVHGGFVSFSWSVAALLFVVCVLGEVGGLLGSLLT